MSPSVLGHDASDPPASMVSHSGGSFQLPVAPPIQWKVSADAPAGSSRIAATIAAIAAVNLFPHQSPYVSSRTTGPAPTARAHRGLKGSRNPSIGGEIMGGDIQRVTTPDGSGGARRSGAAFLRRGAAAIRWPLPASARKSARAAHTESSSHAAGPRPLTSRCTISASHPMTIASAETRRS